MPKIYTFCLFALLLSTVTMMPTTADGIWYYVGCAMASIVCFTVTLFQDEKNVNRPSIAQKVSCSVAASFLAFHLYPSVKDWDINLLIAKFKPFPTIHVFIGISSYFGISIFRELKRMSNFGFRDYLGKIGDQLKAFSKEKK